MTAVRQSRATTARVKVAQTVVCAVLCACAPLVVRAQVAPAGNAHPSGALVDEGAFPNPFAGEPGEHQSVATPAEKSAFASQVKLGPLRDLAVYHNGRVKILDTLARESIRFVAGRKDYIDYIEADDADGAGGGVGTIARRHYDPLFTFLDTLIDPHYYDDKPIVHVEFLPLRRAIVEAIVASPAAQKRWLQRTRLSPVMIAEAFPAIAQEQAADAAFGAALQRVQSQMTLLSRSAQNLEMLAPESANGKWRSVSASGSPTDVRQAFANLGQAWRTRNAATTNAAIAEIAAMLPVIHADMYPGAKRRIEAMYNATHPFDYGAWLYGLSFLLLILAFGTGRKALVYAGATSLAIAAALHASGFAARWIIAERLPIQNQFESMTGLSLAASLAGLAIMLKTRQWLFGAAAAGAGFLILLVATTTNIPGVSIGREAAILNTSVLLKYHVSSVLSSYGLITLGFIMSSFYLWTYYSAKFRGARAAAMAAQGLNLGGEDDTRNAGVQRVLADLDRAQTTILQLAFWILGVGILLGAWWADHSWGRWWGFDPKETWALVTWIIYLIVVHVRFSTGAKRGLVTAWLSVLGFFVMVWTYFGVNLLLPGLHAYA